MTDPAGPLAIPWLTDWEAGLGEARRTREVVLIDVGKNP